MVNEKRPGVCCRDELERRPGVEGRSCIMQIIKEEWKNIKPSVLRYHKELRRELKAAVQGLLGEDWKEEVEKYLH